MVWYFDTDPYVEDYLKYKEKYKGQIELLLGVEMGLQPHLAEGYREYVQKYPFDFIIGSSHLAHGKMCIRDRTGTILWFWRAGWLTRPI